jgi:hypothetical protein
MFSPEWFLQFLWLEYSVSHQTALCFHCRLFATENASIPLLAAKRTQLSFRLRGFNNWKALEKGRSFREHNEYESHMFAEKTYSFFLQQKLCS